MYTKTIDNYILINNFISRHNTIIFHQIVVIVPAFYFNLYFMTKNSFACVT